MLFVDLLSGLDVLTAPYESGLLTLADVFIDRDTAVATPTVPLIAERQAARAVIGTAVDAAVSFAADVSGKISDLSVRLPGLREDLAEAD